jgi:HK97 family phage prohead protease
MKIEQRAAIEVRAEGRRLQGYAAIFDAPTKIFGFTETVQRGAFGKSIAAGDDILALVDHDRTRVLARTRSGTLRLSEDSRGLAFETDDLPNTTAANDILELVRTGNAGGASFGFQVVGEKWQGSKRTLTEVTLREISIVSAWPAYPQTSVSARSRHAASADLALFLKAARATAAVLRRMDK